MTERKPPDLSFTSWIDRQINEAAERGAFDNLPGAGKPLPKRTSADAAEAWLRDYLRPLDRCRVEIDADDPPGGADHFRHDRQPAYGAAAAVDRVPPWLGTDPAERRAGHLRAELSDAQ